MKLQCIKSGVKFTTSCGFGSAAVIHPIFQLPLAKLLHTMLPPYTAGKMNEVDTHLLGSALLDQLPIDRWDCQLLEPEVMLPVWNTNLELVAECAALMHKKDFKGLPLYRINKENCNLENLRVYLAALKGAISASYYAPSEERYKSDLTESLFKILRTATTTAKERNKLPGIISQWAAIVGNFPRGNVKHSNQLVSLREFWKSLIVTAFSPEAVSVILAQDVKVADYEELIEYCETNIPFGTIHYDTLMSTLSGAIEILNEFKPETREVDLSDFMELDTGTSKKVIVPEAPIKPNKAAPLKHQYKSTIEYMLARNKWSQEIIAYANFNSLFQDGGKK